MQKVILCDIDGTLADHKGIRGPFEEHKVLLDKPLPTCEIISALIYKGHEIIFISGRTDKCYEDTKKWLIKNIDYLDDDFIELFMRKSGDFRSDDIIKEEIYNTYIKNKYEVLGVFDDRLKVIRMWEKLGLWVWNCNQGLIEF